MQHFVIGSSLLVSAPLYAAVLLTPRRYRRFSFVTYAFLAPLYFGAMNSLSAALAPKAPLRQRLFWTSQVSWLLVLLFALLTQSYNLKGKEWLLYAVVLYALHLFTFTVTIYGLERKLS